MLPTWRWSLLALLVSWWSSVLASEVYTLEYEEDEDDEEDGEDDDDEAAEMENPKK